MTRARATVARLELPLLALWIGLALVLSSLTTRVVDWFVMTDELLYERLAISVSQLGSPLPHVHGELIPNLNQLYPLLIAIPFRHGLVPSSLHDAHALNAWVMSSACIPAFLLARRVTRRRLVAYALAVLTVCLPWIVVSSFLLTEVAGYPAFLWAMLAIQLAVAAPSRRNDVLALLGIALAVFARTQFELLLARRAGRDPRVRAGARRRRALGCAADARRPPRARGRLRRCSPWARSCSWRSAASLACSAPIAARSRDSSSRAASGGRSSSTSRRSRSGSGSCRSCVGVAWLLANAVRPPARELHAFACLASITIAAVALEVTIFDLRFGEGSVRDRYLFYVAPLVLLGFLCALVDDRWPRWSLVLPTALVTAGFALDHLPAYGFFHADSPVAALHDWLRESMQSLNGARVFLAGATVLATLAFVLLAAVVPRRYLAPALAALTLVVLPLETAYAFKKLLGPQRHVRPAGDASTQGGVFDWVDRTVGTEAGVTIVPYASLPGEYWASVADWWDLEFWNRSVVRSAHFPGQYEFTPSTFPKVFLTFDPRTGAASESPTPYVALSDKETRFRISGRVVSNNRGTLLIEAEQPWRSDWLTFGLYDDGWTKPGVPATVRVYATPGQRRAVTRYISLGVRAPDDIATRDFELTSGGESRQAQAGNGPTAHETVVVCVPPGGFGRVGIRSVANSPVYGDMRDPSSIGEYRVGGVLLTQIALADEVGPPCRTRAPR